MSVVSSNPFAALDEDGDSSPAPAPAKTAQTAAANKQPAASNTPRNVPGSTPRGTGQRGGRYPSRGGPRNVSRDDNGPRNTGPDPASGTMEGFEGAGGFEGERVAPPKRAHQGPDKHTRGPRGGGPRGERNDRGDYAGGQRSRGAGSVRGARVPAGGGGERRQFERKSGTLPDSQKKMDQGWGSNNGPAELDAEELGEGDAQAEENAPQTPAEGAVAAAAADDGGWGAAEETPATTTGFDETKAAEPEEPAEPEEVQKSYDQFLAERAEQALAQGLGKKEIRTVASDSVEGKAFVREGIDEFFFSGKEKAGTKAKAPKKEKVYIEVEGNFARPERSDRPTRGGDRGGRGGGRGGRGGGDRGGDRGGRGRGFGARGRGGFGGASRGGAPQLDGNDNRAFPALGA